jgi:hypothetical protein
VQKELERCWDELDKFGPGYHEVKADNQRLRGALQNILDHQKVVAGDLVCMSGTARLAREALENSDESS